MMGCCPSISLVLVLVFVASFVIPTYPAAAAADDGSNGDSSSLMVAPTSRALLSTSDLRRIDEYHLTLSIYPNGTITAVDPESWEVRWSLHTHPISHSEQALSYAERGGNFIFPGLGGNLYQSSKAIGPRKLNMSIEDLVHMTPFMEGNILTIGSKRSTVTLLDYDTGEKLHEYHFPSALPLVQTSSVKDKLFTPELGNHKSIITIIRDDFYLNSSDSGEFLWSMHDSRVYAYKSVYGGQLPSETSKMLSVFPSRTAIDIERVETNNDMLSLPSTNPPLYLSTLGLPSIKQIVRSLEKVDASTSKMSDSSELECDDACALESDELSENQNGKLIDTQILLSDSLHRSLNNGIMGYATEPMIKDITAYIPKQISFLDAYKILALFVAPLLLLSLVYALGVRFRNTTKPQKQLNGHNAKANVAPKKKKARKGGNSRNIATNSNSYGESYSMKQVADNREYGMTQRREDYLPGNLIEGDVVGHERRIGRLRLTNSEIGKGSNGTVVFEGVYDGRLVAVKRLLRVHHDVAFKEIENLIASDRHPNVVRWYGVEQDLDFVYISLERCICSLSDLIQMCSDSCLSSTIQCSTTSPTDELQIRVNFVKSIPNDIDLWKKDGSPSTQLIKLMRDIVSGLAHLHELGIIHRDLKPQNVLIGDGKVLSAKLSDMGISKRLLQDMSSLSHNATGHGSSGWQAPEQLLHGRQTRAVDLFSLGCILFYCITKGKHPFGSYYERDSNILNNRMDLFLVDHIPEAVHLLSQLLDANPEMRPSAREVLHHPFFWNTEMRLSFLRDASDRVELEDRENGTELLSVLQNVATVAFGGKWGDRLDSALLTDMGRYRKYKFDSARDLLRVIRNKLNHYGELPKELQEILGPVPEGFDSYFRSRFPNLLIEVYKVIRAHCREEDCFRKYFTGSQV